MIPSKVMAKLATLGLSEEQADLVASMLSDVESATKAEADAVLEISREKTRQRVAKWRDTHKSNVTERYVASLNDTERLVRSPARVEDKTLPSEIEPLKEEKKESRSPAKPSPRQRLEAVLDADHAEAVLEHRQRLRKPLTERAASLLAKDLAKFPDPNAAADRMIGKGWLTIEVEWAGAQQRAGPAMTSPPQMADVFKLIKENGNGRQEREDRSGTGAPVSYLPAARSG